MYMTSKICVKYFYKQRVCNYIIYYWRMEKLCDILFILLAFCIYYQQQAFREDSRAFSAWNEEKVILQFVEVGKATEILEVIIIRDDFASPLSLEALGRERWPSAEERSNCPNELNVSRIFRIIQIINFRRYFIVLHHIIHRYHYGINIDARQSHYRLWQLLFQVQRVK